MLCKNENEWRNGMIPRDRYYYDPEESDDDYEPKTDHTEPRADLITIHIYKDQIVKLTEDVIRWMFHKVKGMFKKKTRKRKENAGQDKEKE